ncbi:MAG: hypothetical protein AB9836_08355 [Aminipila sp.]
MKQEEIRKICNSFRNRAGMTVTFAEDYFEVVMNIGCTANRQKFANDITKENFTKVLEKMYDTLVDFFNQSDEYED